LIKGAEAPWLRSYAEALLSSDCSISCFTQSSVKTPAQALIIYRLSVVESSNRLKRQDVERLGQQVFVLSELYQVLEIVHLLVRIQRCLILVSV
jgi:hypothetical protein